MRKELTASFLSMAILISLTLFGLGIVQADPGVFESHPTTHTEIGGLVGQVTDPTNAYDENNDTYAGYSYAVTGGFEVNTFTTHAVNFSILSVDFKMRYNASGNLKAEFRILYYVDPSPTATVLQPWASPASEKWTPRVWSAQPEPNDGSWNWTDINSIRFQVETHFIAGGGKGTFEEYEAWVTVNLGPAPTPKLTVEPDTIDEQSPGSSFFIDVWATDVIHLWGYEFNMSYKTSVLTATSYSSYFPFNIPWPSGIDDAAGVVFVAYSMTFAEPEGFTGRTRLCRIAFTVDAAGGSLLDIYHSVLSDVLGVSIVHDVVDGVYSTPLPEFPLGMAVELALIVAVTYIWWKRKSKTKMSKLANRNTLTR